MTVTQTYFQEPFYRPLHLTIKLSNIPKSGSTNIQQDWFQSYSQPLKELFRTC